LDGGTRVLIVDDHVMLRDAMRLALELAGHDVVGEAGDGNHALRLAEELRPAVVIMDVSLPGSDGIEVTRTLCARDPELRVVMVTMHENLLADGYSMHEVASRLFVSDHTDCRDLSSAYGKLDARHRTEAMLDRVHWGIISREVSATTQG
jgi:DNA-binding NarL/FixJ family response regulator